MKFHLPSKAMERRAEVVLISIKLGLLVQAGYRCRVSGLVRYVIGTNHPALTAPQFAVA